MQLIYTPYLAKGRKLSHLPYKVVRCDSASELVRDAGGKQQSAEVRKAPCDAWGWAPPLGEPLGVAWHVPSEDERAAAHDAARDHEVVPSGVFFFFFFRDGTNE